MRAHTLSRLLAGALCAAATHTAVAQGGAMQNAKPGAMQSAAATAPSGRLVATYHIASRDRAMPERVTVSDSAGTLVASYWLKADSTAHPMGVILYGDDLVLVGETSKGVLELQFYGGNDSKHHGKIEGRWLRNAEEGVIKGRVRG